MRHRVAGKKLGRKTAHRVMMFRNMVTSLLDKERVRTTLDRAKAVRPITEKMITLGKRETLHARRQALAFVKDPAVVAKLFETIAPRFAQRNGGYTRIIRLQNRVGDGAKMAYIELIGSEYSAASKEEPKSKKGAKAKVSAEEKPEKKEKSAKKSSKKKNETKETIE
jgi:large subunit ribosomal protein L17